MQQFIEATVNKTFGKNKKNRIIGIGEAASMVSTTNERWAAPNWKGKDPISESTTVDAPPDAVWSEKFKALEVFTIYFNNFVDYRTHCCFHFQNKCNESQKDVSKYKKKFNAMKSYMKKLNKTLKTSGLDMTQMASTSKSTIPSAFGSDISDSDSEDSLSDEC